MSRKPQMKLAARRLTRAHLQDTHWGQIIIEAEKRGYFLGAEISASKNWTTCACGKQDPRIPRKDPAWSGSTIDYFYDSAVACPTDIKLQSLGGNFHDEFVRNHDFVGAVRCLIAIEKRSHQVLKQARKDDLKTARKILSDNANPPQSPINSLVEAQKLLAKWGLRLKFAVEPIQPVAIPEMEPEFAGAREI